MGRPSEFSQQTADIVCGRISEGESLKRICEDDELPHEATIYRWLAANPSFCDQYAHARRTWADAQIERIQEIARTDERGADHKRLEIDTLKWAMGKLNGKYSDKVKHVGGDDGDSPIHVTGFDVRFV